jgi:hypothetical protein
MVVLNNKLGPRKQVHGTYVYNIGWWKRKLFMRYKMRNRLIGNYGAKIIIIT